MFGIYRLILALLVVRHHYVEHELAGPVGVFGFFCLSGFLMTKVVNEVYGDGLAGIARFVTNRTLRIYPAYWAAIAVSALVVATIPDAALEISKNFRWPDSLFSDLVIFGHVALTPSLSPPAWSLAVELVFYLLIGLGLGRSRALCHLWLAVSLGITLVAMLDGARMAWFIYSLYAGSLPFAAGACLYHWRDRLPPVPNWAFATACAVMLTIALLVPRGGGAIGLLQLCVIGSLVVVAALARLRPNAYDSALGEFAYPVFLLNYPAGAIAIALTGSAGAFSDLLGVAITFALSGAVILLIERPVQALRAKLRPTPQANPRPALQPLPGNLPCR